MPGRAGKEAVPIEGLQAKVTKLLAEVQQALFDNALAFREENTIDAETYDELREAVDGQFVRVYWCGDADEETRIKDETKATSRNFPLSHAGDTGPCIMCGKADCEKAVFARAY
jgi:prolyl-tRNA synthetase